MSDAPTSVVKPAAPAPTDANRRWAELIASASIEIGPRDGFAGPALSGLIERGREVFVSFPGSATHHGIVAACARLQRSGFVPVPHVAARRLTSFTQARDFLQRVAGEAGVDEVLLIGGDPDRALGPFDSSLGLLSSGLTEASGIRRIALAGYPDGHPMIGTLALEAALDSKVAAARRAGLDVRVITQFGFDAAASHRWIAVQRARGIDCPIHVGLAGPASVAALAKFAVRCGVVSSLRALAHGHVAFARILAEATPDTLIRTLIAEEPSNLPLAGLHIFTFGGVRRTAEWLRATAKG
jgi:methylenetetrahydrofolate reductase (NADPH)